jgi:hypothetical protein
VVNGEAHRQSAPCSLGLSATSQQYFSLTTNQPPATSQQYSSLRTNKHQPSATSQPNRLLSGGQGGCDERERLRERQSDFADRTTWIFCGGRWADARREGGRRQIHDERMTNFFFSPSYFLGVEKLPCLPRWC